MLEKKHFHVCIMLLLCTLNINTIFGQQKGSVGSVEDQALVVRYCGNCHRLPEARLLDKATWTGSILPKMGWRLGIRAPGSDPYADMDMEEAQRVRKAGIYPDEAAISKDEWRRIVRYFETTAPDSLPAPDDPVGAEYPGYRLRSPPPDHRREAGAPDDAAPLRHRRRTPPHR